jgi:hypothetical protein
VKISDPDFRGGGYLTGVLLSLMSWLTETLISILRTGNSLLNKSQEIERELDEIRKENREEFSKLSAKDDEILAELKILTEPPPPPKVAGFTVQITKN